MVSVGEIRSWDLAALRQVYDGLGDHSNIALQLEADLFDHGRLEFWDGETADIARLAIQQTRQDALDHVDVVILVRKSVEETQDRVTQLKREFAYTEIAAIEDGFEITDDGAIRVVRPYADENVDDNGHTAADNARRRAHAQSLASDVLNLMKTGDKIEQDSAAQMLNAIGEGAVGADGLVVDGIDAQTGRADGEDARDGELGANARHRLEELGLGEEQLAALRRGEEVVVSDGHLAYLREFYSAAGKDGLVAVSQELSAADSPDAQRTLAALGNGLLTLSNEDVHTADRAEQGGYRRLPADLRDLIEQRDWGSDATEPPRSDNKKLESVVDFAALGNVLAASDHEPGRELALGLGRQVGSLLEADPARVAWPGGDASAERTMQTFLDVASRNHQAATDLLTGGSPVSDLRDSTFDNNKFANVVFSHDWPDDGRAASQLYEWTADSVHSPGMDGGTARTLLAELPNIFAPHEVGESYDDQELPDGAATFREYSNSFHNNPALADAMSRVVTGNLDAFTDPGVPTTATGADGTVIFDRNDGDRLMFLSSLSDQGMKNLITSNELYRYGVFDAALADPNNPDVDMIRNSGIVDLDPRVTTVTTNAQTYLASEDVAARNEAARAAYEFREKIVSNIVDLVAMPVENKVDTVSGQLGRVGEFGSPLASAAIDTVKEDLVQAIVGDEPTDRRVPLPDPTTMEAPAQRRILNEILHIQATHGFDDVSLVPNGEPVRLDQSSTSKSDVEYHKKTLGEEMSCFIDSYVSTYRQQLGDGTAQTIADLNRIMTGNE